ncbi:MAG: vanadium-dependent haloperoxidase [Planctomycetota bacterium]
MSRMACRFLGGLGSMLLVAASAPADVVTDWNEILLDAIRTDATPPPNASRAMAMVHVAIYDAVNSIEGTHEPYLVAASPASGTSAEAATVAAAHQLLVAMYPAQVDALDAAYEQSLAAIADGSAKTEGIALGEAVADAVLAARENDGSTDTVEYTPGTEPGDWQPTPPAFGSAVLPQWPEVTPFAMTDGAQFRRPGPPSLASAEYTTTFNETKSLGRADSTTRTEDQTEVAFFWADGSGTATPPGHWNSIAQGIAIARGNTLAENARLFALLNIALADAAISCWDNKYAYNHWRPVTAIPAADTDGNDDTEADAEWTPLITTPGFPAYSSGHSTFSGAASKMLGFFYGSDEIGFTTGSDALPDVTRTYSGLSEAANEAGRSRIYGGIHWEYDNQDGLGSGRELAIYVYDNFLKPVEALDGCWNGGSCGGPRLCGGFSMGGMMTFLAGFGGLRLVSTRRRRT